MTQFLKLFPGDKDFKEVSEREWEAPYEPFADKDGFGNILGLTADVRVWDRPGGKLELAKKWPSKSFIRNFARLMRSTFSGSAITLFNTAAGSFSVAQAGAAISQNSQAALLSRRSAIIGTGAAMAIGDGSGAEDHTYSDLISRIGDIVVANGTVSTTVDSTSTLTIQMTQGVTVSQSGGITAREIGLYIYIRLQGFGGSPIDDEGIPCLMAYDQIAATPVAQGGVIAPRYTLNFPV